MKVFLRAFIIQSLYIFNLHINILVLKKEIYQSLKEMLKKYFLYLCIRNYQKNKYIISQKKLERYVHFSTSEVYGSYSFRSREDSNTSQGNISDPRWTYAISKLSAEKLGYCYHFEKQLPMVSIRPFNIYGPWQIGEGAIQSFITKAINNIDIPVTGDGSQIRAWCFIEDIIDAVILCVEKEQAVGHTFNIGNPEETMTILSLAKKILKITNSKSKIYFKEHIGTDIELRIPDISKAKKILGYSPKIGIDEGLSLSIDFFKQNPQ